ncbi:hypothetical protein AMTRI_Chr09g18440 [Amborella trichopoda]|uniref:Ribosomal protein P1 n=1 Tax=Amborella trichopoda TaxID=13333 RepID=W1P0E4_AMBTC|nr:60S acidic ribosomal protein P1 [Amborella trichopoda]XP_011621268.1 60S acidic ribosomal protein P1 [Amborella trichopoda]ERN00415.1 hypothetical protein AMTR_s00100p00050800 [Amborella trichopoda]|eukprot:XP_006837846.1 60S acidic ribosomal protein P1 [Amborella trichopoda]
MSVSELGCIYASLLLQDDGIPITAEKISAIVKAAHVPVDSFWPPLFSKLFQKRTVDDLIASVGAGGGGGAAVVAAPTAGAGAAAAAAPPPAAEEKKEEPKEESDEDMGFSLFD